MFGSKSEDTIGDSRKLHKKSIIVCELVNNYGATKQAEMCDTCDTDIYRS
jgi:hypothetical protein